MKLFVGLGNPGKKYDWSRHTLGFLAIEKFADLVDVSLTRTLFNGNYAVVKDDRFDDDIILLEPQTFMNLSGECIKPFADYFKIPQEDIVIVHDDMALPVGKIRLRPSGSHGGHNGMRNIIDMFGNEQIKRIKIGIGEPPYDGIDYVLSKPSEEERTVLEEAVEQVSKALRDIALHGFEYAMNHYNVKEEARDKPV